jgi:hypothetical protein
MEAEKGNFRSGAPQRGFRSEGFFSSENLHVTDAIAVVAELYHTEFLY